MVDQSKLASTIRWLVAAAQPLKSIEAITEETALRLCQAGVPIEALIVDGLFIHPQIRGMQIAWTRRNGVRRLTYDHRYFETNAFDDTWSPPASPRAAPSLSTSRWKKNGLNAQDAAASGALDAAARRARR